MPQGRSSAVSVEAFGRLVTTASWQERWPDEKGSMQTRAVTAEVWTAAIQAALDKHRAVFLPQRAKPYYIDGPIVLRSGTRIVADPQAEIRLKPHTNTCMVRNENIVCGHNAPVPTRPAPDTQIAIEGGIWTTLATSHAEWNGNTIGRINPRDDVPFTHGVILLSHVSGVRVSHVTIKESRCFGVHLTYCSDFLVEDITFVNHGRDGVHVNGPSHYGVIRQVRGITYDDLIALNAWEWRNYTPTFGPIHHVLVEGVLGSFRPDGASEVRLLPGTKTFPDGRKLDCSIHDCVFRDLTDIYTFKVYDQPNLELGRANDFCDPIGSAVRLFFRNLTYHRPGRFHIGVNVEGLSVGDVRLEFDPTEGPQASFKLIEIGPQSATYKHDPSDPTTWVEIFSPDKDCTVRNLRLTNVSCLKGGQVVALANPMQTLVRVIQQAVNTDYPKTTPRGGVGKGILLK